MAEKKYPGDEEGLAKLKAKILETGGPVAHGVTVWTLNVLSHLIWHGARHGTMRRGAARCHADPV